MRAACEFQALQETFQGTSNQLQELELDLINWYTVEDDLQSDDPDGFFVRQVFGLCCDDTRQIFPSLRILSLSAVSFTSMEKEMLHAFNLPLLLSLKLRYCPSWDKFLQLAIRSREQINLKSLEIQWSLEYDIEDEDEAAILDFLEAFEGLEELFIYTSSSLPAQDLWRAALHHKSTLRRFVHHQRAINMDNQSQFLRTYDPPTLSLDPSQNFSVDLDLECLGICCIPIYLVR